MSIKPKFIKSNLLLISALVFGALVPVSAHMNAEPRPSVKPPVPSQPVHDMPVAVDACLDIGNNGICDESDPAAGGFAFSAGDQQVETDVNGRASFMAEETNHRITIPNIESDPHQFVTVNGNRVKVCGSSINVFIADSLPQADVALSAEGCSE